MKKSTRKTGQDGAKANAPLVILSKTVPPKSTLFLPNLRREFNKVVLTSVVLFLDNIKEERTVRAYLFESAECTGVASVQS